MSIFPPVKMHPCPGCGTEQAFDPPSGRYRDCPCGLRIPHARASYVDGWAMWAFLTGWGAAPRFWAYSRSCSATRCPAARTRARLPGWSRPHSSACSAAWRVWRSVQ